MPMSYDNLDSIKPSRDDFAQFIAEQAGKSRPARRRKKTYTSLYNKRSINLVIRESATEKTYMRMRYKKTSTGKTKDYTVAPYSFRYLRSQKTGRRRKALFAYDTRDNKIKSYYVKNIKSIQRTDAGFRPKWDVEISM